MVDRARPGTCARWCGVRSRVDGIVGVLVIGELMACVGCARSPLHPWEAATKSILWPLPPDAPRIRYEGTITRGQPVRFRNGRFALLDLLLGRPRIMFQTPHGVSVDAITLAITDSGGARVHLFHLAERRHREVGKVGDEAMQSPVGVATDGKGGVFVSDSALARVFHLSAHGEIMGEIRGDFVRPTGLAFDRARRRLYVVDTGEHTVFSFQEGSNGFVLLRKLGERGEEAGGFNFPTHAAVDGEGALYVADSLNHRIQVFDRDGKLVRSFGQAGDSTGDFAKAKGVAVDSEGRVYVVDSLYDVVQIFDREGRCLLAFGGSGREEGLLWLPSGICIDDEDRIYVADSDNSRVQVYQHLRASP